MRGAAMAIVVAAFPALVRAELLPIKTYTTADGLASDSVTRIVVDSRGFLWFCTPEGLSRFDGTHFVNYGTEDGLPDRSVAALHEARSGDLWVATARGLGRIAASAHAARFTTLALVPEDAAASVGALAESRSGGMWAATKRGLFAWDGALNVHQRDVPPPAPARITDLTEDSAGRLWVGTTDGIVVLGKDGSAIRRFAVSDGLPGAWVEMLAQDSRGRVWAALRGGLARFDPGADGEPVLQTVYTDALAGTDVKAVTEASDGTLWVGTTQGISRLRFDLGGRVAIERLTRAQGLSDRSIHALAEDQAGNMWVGTESAGAMRIGRLGFTTFREPDGLSSDRVWSVLEGRAGELVAVTIIPERKRSVDVFGGGRFRRFSPAAFSDNPAWGMNQVLLQSRAGEWWAATRLGLCRFDAVPAEKLNGRKPRVCYAADAMIFSLFEDSRGGIWASARSPQGDRLMRWSSETDAVFQFAHPRVPEEPHEPRPDDLVSAFAEDRQGHIWMGLYKGGLYRYDGREFRHFDQRDGVPRGTVLALLATGNGLWIGSDGGGLARIEHTEDPRPRVEVWDLSRGMSSDIVPCLVEDRAGRLYAATARGVDRLDPDGGHVRHFSAADGLAHGACKGALRDRTGSLWFATTQGLSRLIPAEDPKPLKPQILITAARVGGQPWGVSPRGETRIVLPDLQPSQNRLQAEFVGIDHEPGAVVRFSYRLEGADAAWSPPRNQPSVSYAALGSGTYRFLVKAVTSDGTESAAPAEIDFRVLAPVWRRAWFVALAATVGVALVLAAHRYRVAQMLSLERMRTSIATDLHDDLGASLSQIAILSEVARVGGNGKGSAEPLERVAVLARELVDSINDIVWSIRSEPHGWDSLVRHMREFALDVLVSQGIDFQLRTPHSGDGAPMSLQVRRQLFLMFKECIHNVARHSRSTAVVAELGTGHREVVLTVEDNGVGRNADAESPGTTGGSGIAGMQRRAASLGGRLEFTSTPGRGCRVEIHLPVGRGPGAAGVP